MTVDLLKLEYPRHLHGPRNADVLVYSAEECAARLAEGWSLDGNACLLEEWPKPAPTPEPVPAKRGPGRPRKGQS